MIGAIVAGIYAAGYVLTAIVMCREFADDGVIDRVDIAAALYFALGWPVLAPFAAFVWAVSKVLPRLGFKVKS